MKNYLVYPYDNSPEKKYATIWKEFNDLDDRAKQEGRLLTRTEWERKLAIVEQIAAAEPQWIDGYWLVANVRYMLASTYMGKEDLHTPRVILAVGREKTRTCLKLQPDNPICKMVFAGIIAKIATIDGVLASLSQAETVHRLWLEVIDSPYNHYFTARVSMQGAVRYGLGIYHRLIPDFLVIQWLFNVRGNINQSIKYLKEAIAIDGEFPCTRVMLGVSLICSASSDQQHPNYSEGIKSLQKAEKLPRWAQISDVCKADAKRIIKNTNLACGYSTSQQQEQHDQSKLKTLKK
ncbi:MAG: hypothetical protein CMP10_03460 [Zetaproteobacteria bacterium]|nr:hypothetical protein [Pseudobdellovibrionaceae bacterium]